MEEVDASERAATYADILKPALNKLRTSFIEVVNEKADISVFLESIRELDNARQVINSAENIGLVIGIAQYMIVAFPLKGDPKRDLGQTHIDLPEID